MSKITNKHVQVYEMMKHGKSVSLESLAKTLACKQNTVMALIFGLRRHAGGDVETERDGRKVVSYKLTNASAIASKMVSKAKATKAPKAAKVAVLKTKTKVSKTTKAVANPDLPTLDIEEVNDEATLESLKAELGLSESYSE